MGEGEKRMKKTTVTLDEQELRELDQILLDQDAQQGLKFLEQLKAKIKSARTRVCGITTPEGG
jgi:hypothetical protein